MNFSGKEFCRFSRTGGSNRFPTRDMEVRVLSPQTAVSAYGSHCLYVAIRWLFGR